MDGTFRWSLWKYKLLWCKGTPVLSAVNEISDEWFLVEVTVKRYIVYPRENITLGERKELKSVRTQYKPLLIQK